MRVVLVVVISLVLFGCQQNQAQRAVSTATPEKYQTTGFFDARVEAAVKAITDKAAAECISGATVTELVQELGSFPCLKAALLRAFDKTGEIKKNCPAEGTLDKFAECVLAGGFVSELFSGYGEQPGPDVWRDTDIASREFALIVMKKDGAECIRSGTAASDLSGCMFKSMADHLQILPDDEEKCADIDEMEKHASCLGEAAMAEYLERTSDSL